MYSKHFSKKCLNCFAAYLIYYMVFITIYEVNFNMVITQADKNNYVNKMIENFNILLDCSGLTIEKFYDISGIGKCRLNTFLQEKSISSWKTFIVCISIFSIYPAALDKMLELNIIDAKLLLFLQNKETGFYNTKMMANYKPIFSQKKRENYCKKMSNNLSILRKYVNLSQQELSNISGVTNLYICNYENNSRKMNWNTFLLFLFIFLQNDSTTFYMKQKSIYTEEIKLFLRGVYSDESDFEFEDCDETSNDTANKDTYNM